MQNNPTIEQQQFMSDNRPHYDTLIRADFLTNIGQDVKNGLLEVARVFAPAMQANLWCGPCVCDLVKYAYTQYDKWVETNKELESVLKENDIQFATFPKQDEPQPPAKPDLPEPTLKFQVPQKSKRGRKAKAK